MARRANLLPALLLGVCLCLLASFFASQSFVASQPGAARAQSRVARRGFKEDFDAWRSALSPEERKLVLTQAQGEFNKKFRKSDEFKKDIPSEKVEAFGKILSKFFDAEAKDYKKEVAARTPNYNGLLEKAGDKELDFSLRNKIIEVDRDADRRYNFASMKIREAEAKGELFPQSSPMQEVWIVQNNDTDSHEGILKAIQFVKDAAADPSASESLKKHAAELAKMEVPAIGKPFELSLPQVMVNQVLHFGVMFRKAVSEANMTEAETKKFHEEKGQKVVAEVVRFLTDKYVAARDEVQAAADSQKAFFRSQKDRPGKTKADILKEIWAELPKHVDKPLPPLDNEMLAELAAVPAIIEGEYRHSWGIADKLYKSEAIDPFGIKYLLGVFETPAAAEKAFKDWSAEYDKARKDMKDEMQQWSKQENARLDKDTSAKDRIAAIREEARNAALA